MWICPSIEHQHHRILKHFREVVRNAYREIVVVELHPSEQEETQAENYLNPSHLRSRNIHDDSLPRVPGRADVHDSNRQYRQYVYRDFPVEGDEQVDKRTENCRAAERQERLR